MNACASTDRRAPPRAALATCLALALGTASMAAEAPLAQAAQPVPWLAAHSPQPEKPAANRAQSRAASTIVVTTCDDAGPGSLRAAASAAVSGDTIDLSALLCSSISLTSGAIPLPIDDVFLVGPTDRTLSIEGNGTDRILSHAGSGTLAVSGLTIRGGAITTVDYGAIARGGCIDSMSTVALDHVVLSDCKAASYGFARGGAIAAGSVSLVDSRIEYCSAVISPGYGGYSKGGAIYSDGPLSITRSVVSGNSATALQGGAHGGALDAYRGLIEIVDSTLSGNTATGRLYAPTQGSFAQAQGMGGAVFSGDLVISGSTLSGNTASSGGAIAMLTGTASQIVNSTLSGNTALSKGGAIWIALAGISVLNSTITLNQATYGGGGVMPQHPLFAGIYNYAFVLQGSVIADNESLYFSRDVQGELPGLTIAGTHNLIGDSSITLPPDTLGGDPMLLPLADNGGPTWTHSPAIGSPLLHTGNNETNLPFDQRGVGFPRVVGAAPDIGALEYSPPPDVIFDDGFD